MMEVEKMSNKQKQKYSLKPLMYIVQPDNRDVNVNMQSFVVKKAKKEEVIQRTVVSENTDSLTKTKQEKNITLENQLSVKEKIEEVAEETPKNYRKQRKPITQMNVMEKIEFFTNLPKNMPRTLCEIETTEGKYRGVIMEREEEMVTIRSLTHTQPVELPLESIKVIQLLGF